MGRPLESFEFLNRGWDVRLLETQSLRTVFVVLLIDVFLLGMFTFMMIYELFRLHHFHWSTLFYLMLFTVNAVRYLPVIYRRLGR